MQFPLPDWWLLGLSLMLVQLHMRIQDLRWGLHLDQGAPLVGGKNLSGGCQILTQDVDARIKGGAEDRWGFPVDPPCLIGYLRTHGVFYVKSCKSEAFWWYILRQV